MEKAFKDKRALLDQHARGDLTWDASSVFNGEREGAEKAHLTSVKYLEKASKEIGDLISAERRSKAQQASNAQPWLGQCVEASQDCKMVALSLEEDRRSDELRSQAHHSVSSRDVVGVMVEKMVFCCGEAKNVCLEIPPVDGHAVATRRGCKIGRH